MSNERGRGWGCILLTLLLGGLLGTGAAMADDSTGLHPTLVGRVAPYYPPEAIHLRHEGTTLVHISVDAQGVLHDVTVLKSSGYPELDQAALTAVNQWKYQPAVDHGMAVDSEMQVPVTFKIKFADAEDNTQGGSRLSASQAAQVDAHFRQMDEASAKVQQSSLLAKQALAKKYQLVIQKAVRDQFLHPDNMPATACTVRIIQRPGGTVLSAKVDPACPYDDQAKRSVESAVYRAMPLPYKGYETVFSPDIEIEVDPR